MNNSTIANDRTRREVGAIESFLDSLDDESFTEVFLTFTPQLASFFRSHGCGLDLSEDLSPKVMLTVYRNSWQLRDRTRFRSGYLRLGVTCFTGITKGNLLKSTPLIWTSWLTSTRNQRRRRRSNFIVGCHFWNHARCEVLALRFVGGWEYHEIAAAKAIPMGTVEWRAFNARKKLAALLKTPGLVRSKGA